MPALKELRHCPVCGESLVCRYVQHHDRLFCERCGEPVYENPVPATAAVVINEKREVLLVRRARDPQKGKWCLPGGFVELGETPEECCLRELAEETGISGRIAELVGIHLSRSYSYHSVLVIGYAIENGQGTLCPGDDAEEAAFFPAEGFPEIAFHSHSLLIRKALRLDERGGKHAGGLLAPFGAYVVTSLDHRRIARDACAGGARVIQYREKSGSRRELLETAAAIRRLTRESGSLFIVNDFLDIALLTQADGVHLGQSDVPLARARELAPEHFIVGVSARNLEEALAAAAAGADYIGIGPVFPTPTKDEDPPIGLAALREVVDRVKIPLVAIGGIDLDNMAELHALGVRSVAMVRAFQQDTAEAVRRVNRLFLHPQANESRG